MTAAEPLVAATSLAMRYGDIIALEPVDLELGPGELVVLSGHNGAGKSTLLALLAGQLEPTSGLVRVAGVSPVSIAGRRAVSYLPDTAALYPDLSVAEHLEYVAALHGADSDDYRGEELMVRLGLESRAGQLPLTLSHGLRQKAWIAIAFVRPFKLLLADEPFSGLDVEGRKAVVELLLEATAGGASAIVVTHQSELVEHASRQIVLGDGRLVHDGDPQSIDSQATDEPEP